MIKKICLSMIIISLFIAIPLAIFGIKKIELGPSFLSFMNQVSKDMESWKIAIPDIPKIPEYSDADGFVIVLNALIKLVNTLTSLINIVSTILNVVIQVLQFICTLLWDLQYLIKNMENIGDPNYIWAW